VYEELNRANPDDLRDFKHGKIPLPKTAQFLKTLEAEGGKMDVDESTEDPQPNPEPQQNGTLETEQDHRATYIESPLRPVEKRRVTLRNNPMLKVDKLVWSTRPCPTDNNRQPALPPTPPHPRRTTNLL
jgi:hypothetical protein